MSIKSSIFNWFKPEEATSTPTKQTKRNPNYSDKTESMTVNKALTYGLYHNTYPGLKLAGAMAFTPIAVPLWFMGLPVPTLPGSESANIFLEAIIERFPGIINQIHLQCHREGTVWVFPKFSAKKRQLVWEFISDETVSDIVKDFDTNDIIQLITDEEITISTGYGKTATVRRIRSYTKDLIDIKWLKGSGEVPESLQNETMFNPTGVLPIPFSNNADGDEKRGHSDYSRIITDLKDYHDISLKQSKVLAKFEPKLNLNVKDVDAWLENNGEEKGSLSTLEIFSRDVVFTVEGESAEYLSPDNAYQAYEAALKRCFRKIVEGSAVPELLWGTKMEGNHASAEEQMNNVVKFIEDKRQQKEESYQLLFAASLELLNISTGRTNSHYEIKIEWNSLDTLSDETKAKVIKDFAQGLAFMVNAGTASKEMAYELWNKMFPGVAPETFELFDTGLNEMIKHKQYLNTDLETTLDMRNPSDLDDDELEDEEIDD